MASAITSFTAGDLVVSLSGDANSGNTYYDNQGTPLTLEELTTAGADVGSFVLPQTTTTNANGVTESAISAEYGSSSEGTLELSTDGTALVIAGYGVNAATYNAAETGYQPTSTTSANSKEAALGGEYGSGALAQTYSVPSGMTNGAPSGDIVTPRVVAVVGADGSVDTSTSLTNVFNTNNPRSVATADGSSFYLSGQGVKGDNTTQGVFTATDGETGTPTAIYTAVDTRTAELYNKTLYVSEDSSINKGTGGIYSYGTDPTGTTTPTALPGLSGSITLTAGQGNSINGSSGTVDLSPENFFFANATTLYVADSGNPKGGTAGDGGLQKWSLVTNPTTNVSTWTLDYTLSKNLNLVSNSTSLPSGNSTGYGTDATTGLIGLTGQVSADGTTVSLYATNATIGDLNNTYVYSITDTLASTSAATSTTEGFTQIYQAPADTNVRGIAFAPQCFVTGTRIATARGEVAVEDLAVGDLAVTASGVLRPIRWIGHRVIAAAAMTPDLAPVRVAAGAFGPGVPARDLLLSPGHPVLVGADADAEGGHLVPIMCLVNGTTVRRLQAECVTYWHVELDAHDILLAEGLAAESYLEFGDRGFFAENAELVLANPDFVVPGLAERCRPVAVDGPVVEAERRRLDAVFAGALAAACAWPDAHVAF